MNQEKLKNNDAKKHTLTNLCKNFSYLNIKSCCKISCEEGSVLPEFSASKRRKWIHLLRFSISSDLLPEYAMKTLKEILMMKNLQPLILSAIHDNLRGG